MIYYSLAILFKIEYKEDIDIYELYIQCMKYLNDYSNSSKTVISNRILFEYKPYDVFITKKPTSVINYTYRPRLGVKSPGEVYTVHKDKNTIMYAVPFKFSVKMVFLYTIQNFYNQILRNIIILKVQHYLKNKMKLFSLIKSSMYILVEYKDEYSKVKLFREGVSLKKC